MLDTTYFFAASIVYLLVLFALLAARFPHHTLYCDLMRKRFFETYSRPIHEKIAGMGATFTDMAACTQGDWAAIIPHYLEFAAGLPDRILRHLELLRGDYKQADYGKVILPFTVLRRLADRHVVIEKGRTVWRGTNAEMDSDWDRVHGWLGV